MQLLTIFIVLNILNVIIQTAKSLATIKCGKTIAATANAIAFGLYTVVLVYMNCELPLMFKVIVVAITNFIGVYVVKWFEEKIRRDKLWKVEATISKYPGTEVLDEVKKVFEECHVPYNYIDIGKYYLINIYCASQTESAIAKKFLNAHGAKYFVTEAKTSIL